MGSDERHFFNISLIVRHKVTRQRPQTTTFEEKGKPKRIRTEVPLLTSLKPDRWAKPARPEPFITSLQHKRAKWEMGGQYRFSGDIFHWLFCGFIICRCRLNGSRLSAQYSKTVFRTVTALACLPPPSDRCKWSAARTARGADVCFTRWKDRTLQQEKLLRRTSVIITVGLFKRVGLTPAQCPKRHGTGGDRDSVEVGEEGG